MDKNKIIEKLKVFLTDHKTFKEECEVVYLMAEIRKVLDLDQSFKSDCLRFYSNWSLHTDLSKDRTTKFISNMFDQYIDLCKCYEEIDHDIKMAHPNFFKLNDLKSELTKFFTSCSSLPSNLISNNTDWFSFVKLLLSVIEECQTISTKESSKKIDNLTLIKNEVGVYCYKFSFVNSRNIVVKLKLKLKN